MPAPRTTGTALAVPVLVSASGDTAAFPATSKGLLSRFSCNGFGARTAAWFSPAGQRALGHAFCRLPSSSSTLSLRALPAGYGRWPSRASGEAIGSGGFPRSCLCGDAASTHWSGSGNVGQNRSGLSLFLREMILARRHPTERCHYAERSPDLHMERTNRRSFHAKGGGFSEER